MQDSQIVELYWERNEKALTHTQTKYGGYLHTIAYNILYDREDAKESVNDTYLAAWNSIPPHRPQVLSTYLGKLARRIAIDLFRKKNSQKRGAGEYALSLQELQDCVSHGNTPEAQLDVQMLSQAIAAYLQGLPAEARNVFLGRYYYLDPVKKIATYCHITEAKVKMLLFRTRQGLKDYLSKEGYF